MEDSGFSSVGIEFDHGERVSVARSTGVTKLRRGTIGPGIIGKVFGGVGVTKLQWNVKPFGDCLELPLVQD
jgi:hypothetical protein